MEEEAGLGEDVGKSLEEMASLASGKATTRVFAGASVCGDK